MRINLFGNLPKIYTFKYRQNSIERRQLIELARMLKANESQTIRIAIAHLYHNIDCRDKLN